MISISDSHWLAGVREATGCTADQARVYLAVATMPLSSQANVSGVLQWRPRRVQTALKSLMDGGLLRFYNLGCETLLSRRYYINYGRILTFDERFLDLWAPLLHWHVPACLAYLLQRLPLLEHIYAAVADQHGIGPLEEFRWCRGTPWRAAARFRDGWVPYHWIGTPSRRGDIADTLNRTAEEIQDQIWEGEAPLPHHMVIITPDLWQEWQVSEVAGEMGILPHLQLRSVRGGIVYGPREGWPSRGWVVDPLPPPRPGPWTLEDQLAASRWRHPGGQLATRLVDCVLEWPGATSRFATAYVYGCRDKEKQKVVLDELDALCARQYLRSEPFDGRSRMHFIDAAGYDFATTRDGVHNGGIPDRYTSIEGERKPSVVPHELGARELAQEFLEEGLLVVEGRRYWEHLGEGGIEPDALVYLRGGPFGDGWHFLEYELRVRGRRRADIKLRGFSMTDRRQNDWPVLVAARDATAEKHLERAGYDMGVKLLTTNVARLRSEGALRCWNLYGQPAVVR